MANPNVQLHRLRSDGLADVGNKRSLGAENFVNEENEERAPAWVTKITNVFNSKDTQLRAKLKDVVDAQQFTDEAFSVLRLNRLDPDLFAKPKRLATYVKHSELASKKTGSTDVYGIKTLLKTYKDDELTAMINRGLVSKDKTTRETSTKLRAGQYDVWLSEGKQVHDIAKWLKTGKKRMSALNRAELRKYRDRFNDKYVKNLAA